MSREITLFTEDKKLPILLLEGSRYTELVMRQAHEKGHVGSKATVVKFRTNGYWTVRAGLLAKKVKRGCVIC